MFDVYMSRDHDVTVEMSERLRGLKIHWFEDVSTPDDLQGNSRLRPLVKPTLIAGGEHEFTHFGFAEVARTEAYDLWQPGYNLVRRHHRRSEDHGIGPDRQCPRRPAPRR